LEFVENLNVKEQLVSGMMYYITLVATDAGNKKEYEAKIWVKEWEDFKKVIEFKLVGDDLTILGPIPDAPIPNSPEFQDLTRFAIQQYNKNQVIYNDLLIFYLFFLVNFTFNPIIFKSRIHYCI